MAILVEEGLRPNGDDLVVSESSQPLGVRMLGAVAAGCRAAESEAGDSDISIVCVAYDHETGSINLASSHDKERTSNALMVAVRKFTGMEIRLPWGDMKKAAEERKARKTAHG